MVKKESIKTLFETRQQQLTANLGPILSHPTTKGDNCEQCWIDFLKSFLPSKYGVTKGYVFDHLGNLSEQIDVIIYDALYSPLIFETQSGEKYVTAESVYAIFDSKPKINARNIEYTNKKILSVKKLNRTSRNIINAGKIVPARTTTPILGGVLAASTVGEKTLTDSLTNNKNVQFGLSADGKIMFFNDGIHAPFVINDEQETILAFFYKLLDELHKIGTVPCIDIREYARQTLSGSLNLFEEQCDD